MNTKDLKFVITDGEELHIITTNCKVIDLENSDLSVGKIVFKKKELPTKWEDLKTLKGYYVNNLSEINSINFARDDNHHKNLFPTKAEAEACLALSQLCQLRDAYNGEPLANWCDWTNNGGKKWVIYFYNNSIYTDYTYIDTRILAFKTLELRDKFVKNFRELIEIAKPLL